MIGEGANRGRSQIVNQRLRGKLGVTPNGFNGLTNFRFEAKEAMTAPGRGY